MKRVPPGLTLAALVVLALLVGLGVWQLRRLAETTRNRQRIEALAHAPAIPLAPLLASGANLDHRRVSVDCGPPPSTAPIVYRYALADGTVAWRLLTMCSLTGGAYDGVLLDRGLIAAAGGAMAPPATRYPAPGSITGVLRRLGAAPLFSDSLRSDVAGVTLLRVLDAAAVRRIAALAGIARPAPYYVVVEAERPAVAGVSPAPVAEDVPRDNFQYALTWFGLAAALACVYAAFIWRRLRSR